jgi:hypothetical protein
MKTIKRLLTILSLFLLTSCGVQWQYTTLNHDPIYDDENYIVVSDDVKIDTLNEFQFRNKLRTDFNFRWDFAQYALSQPRSFDWNNRILGNRYNWNRNNWGYSYYNYWNRTQMWNDWVWGFRPHRYDMWGYNNWMGNAHWGYSWNNHYGWNGWYNNNWGWRSQMNDYAWQNRNRSNTVRVNGKRVSISDEVVNNRIVRTNNRTRTNTKTVIVNKPVVNNSKPVWNNNKPIIRNNNRPSINNNKPIIRNNNRPPINNTRPVIRNNNTRPTNNSSTKRSGGTSKRQR